MADPSDKVYDAMSPPQQIFIPIGTTFAREFISVFTICES